MTFQIRTISIYSHSGERRDVTFNPDPAVVGTEFIREGGRGGPERSGRWCEHCVGLWKRTTRGLTFSGT